MYNHLYIIIKIFLSGCHVLKEIRSLKRHVIPWWILYNTSKHVICKHWRSYLYWENGQMFICHIFEINITYTNNIAYYNINIIKTNVSILLQKLKLKNFLIKIGLQTLKTENYLWIIDHTTFYLQLYIYKKNNTIMHHKV